MRSRTFFNRPAFASVTPEKKRYQSPQRISSPSSPLSNPSPSSFIDLTSELSNEQDTRPKPPLFRSVDDENDITPTPTPPEPSSQSLPRTDEAPPSSLCESFQTSQRIMKGGKEVVISSDGDETDSDSSLGEDPTLLFARKFKPSGKPTAPKPAPPPKPRMTTPKKYRNTIESLVHAAVDDNETESNVAKVRAGFASAQTNVLQQGSGQNTTGAKSGLREEILTSVLAEDDEEDGVGLRRLLDAVRRTEALDQDKTWRFLDQTQTKPIAVEFPKSLFPPTSSLAALREPESRERLFQSGVLEFAASLPSQSQPLPDEFILWLFRSLPLEPREELRQAYWRVVTNSTRVKSILSPSDVDCLFKQLGASSQALDFSKPIKEEPSNKSGQESSLKYRGSLLSVFDLLRDAAHAQILDNDSTDRAIQILLRITIDSSLTADDMIRLELQSCLSALLETVADEHIEEMERRICTTVYETFLDVQFQSRMLQHILPTIPWISLLRYRLAMAFLLRSPDPLTEPAEDVLDMKRQTQYLTEDERLKVKSHSKKSGYDYGDLIAISVLLDMVINNYLWDLHCQQAGTEAEFNAAIDKLAAQINIVFSAIEDSGAAHLKRMLAKQALEAVHYRVMYSVRTKPPPPKRAYDSAPLPKKDGNINRWLKSAPKETREEETAEANREATAIPIRKHGSP